MELPEDTESFVCRSDRWRCSHAPRPNQSPLGQVVQAVRPARADLSLARRHAHPTRHRQPRVIANLGEMSDQEFENHKLAFQASRQGKSLVLHDAPAWKAHHILHDVLVTRTRMLQDREQPQRTVARHPARHRSLGSPEPDAGNRHPDPEDPH